jgi:WD40 repeat protein
VVHRDVKPGNVMVREDGEPLLMDFGLAARNDETEKLTVAGQFMGTPEYTAPEQWRGEAQPASDQYSLGCLLFEVLTGEKPFSGGSTEHYLMLHTQMAPPSPRTYQPDLPRDLETICLKCLEKEPGRRYDDCQALAIDLRRWQEGEPIAARRVGPAERLLRWGRKNPATAGLIAVVAVLLLAGTLVAWVLAGWALAEEGRAKQAAEEKGRETIRAEAKAKEAADNATIAGERERDAFDQKKQAEARQKEADEQRSQAELLVYASKLAQAQLMWKDDKPVEALGLLEECQWNLRDWEHRHLWTLYNSNQATLQGHKGSVLSVAYSPDGKRIVSGSQDNTVKVWDANKGQEILSFKGHTSAVDSVVWSPDGKRIVTANRHPFRETTVKVWDDVTGQQLLAVKGSGPVAYSPDGKYIVSRSGDRTRKGRYVGPDKTLKVWDAQTGQERISLKGHAWDVLSVAYSPDGKRIASSGAATVRVWDAKKGEEILSLKGSGPVAFSPDGKHVVCASGGSSKSTLKVWDVATGQEILSFTGRTGEVTSVSYSPDGKRIVCGSGGQDQQGDPLPGEVKMWDAATGQELLSLKGHLGNVRSVAYSPDGRCIVSGSEDHTIKVWDAEKSQEVLSFEVDTVRPVRHSPIVAHSPDGSRIVSSSRGYDLQGKRLPGEIKVWDTTTGQQVLSLKGHTDVVYDLAYSSDSKRIVSSGSDFGVTFSAVLRIFRRYVESGELASSELRSHTLKEWDAATGQQLRFLKGSGPMKYSPNGKLFTDNDDRTGSDPVVFSPDGKRIVSSGGDGRGKYRHNPDGTKTVFVGDGKTLKLWDAATGGECLSLKGHTSAVNSVAWSPDGKRIVSGSHDKTLKVWDAQTGQEILSLQGHTGSVYGAAYSPDGKRIVSGGGDHTLKVWDAEKGLEVLSLTGHTGPVQSVGYSRDGKRIVSHIWVGTVKVWNAEKSQDVLSLKGLTGKPTSVAYSPDGKRIYGKDDTGKGLTWDAATGQLLPNAKPVKIPQQTESTSPDGSQRAFIVYDQIKVVLLKEQRLNQALDRAFLARLAWPDSAYHRQRADQYEKSNDLFAAAFHLRRLLLIAPDEVVRQRLAAVESKRAAQAKTDAALPQKPPAKMPYAQ